MIPSDAPIHQGERPKCPKHFYEMAGPCTCPDGTPLRIMGLPEQACVYLHLNPRKDLGEVPSFRMVIVWPDAFGESKLEVPKVFLDQEVWFEDELTEQHLQREEAEGELLRSIFRGEDISD